MGNVLCHIYFHNSFVRVQCPVMCGICKGDGSAGEDFISAPSTQLIDGSSRHLTTYTIIAFLTFELLHSEFQRNTSLRFRKYWNNFFQRQIGLLSCLI